MTTAQNLMLEHSGQDLVVAREVFEFLHPLSDAYPNIGQWYMGKVVPGWGVTRHVTIIRRHGDIAALGIAKDEHGEKKICTVRVAPVYEGRGMGIRVMDQLMEWLNTDAPLATVSEEKMPDFDKIFTKYGFQLTSVVNGLYRPNSIEYMFNECSSPLMELKRSR